MSAGPVEVDREQLLAAARGGDDAALGTLLGDYTGYLELLSRVHLGRRIQGKVDAADLVQEVFLEAHRHFADFRGTEVGQFTCWLRRILAARMANLLRRWRGVQGRDVGRERELELAADLDASSRILDRGLISSEPTPSRVARGREESLRVAEALMQLPDDYREAVVLRNLEGLGFPEVAEKMGRSVDSVQKLWVRALARLRKLLGGRP